MQIIKDTEHSVLIKHFNVQGQDYLSVTTMLYFDLVENRVSTEQKMWNEVMPYLRNNQPLDEALPKAKAEFLAYGHCFSKIPTKAKEVTIKVGEIEKTLDVIGDRYYYKNFLGNIKITKPEDFQKIKLSFENAYGGEDYAYNNVGRGFLSNKNIGDNKVKLHNIDAHSHKSASSIDEKNVLPQSFEPLSVAWKTRMDKAGTYDEDWYKTRWPYFANDMSKEYFNTALDDQWCDEYFSGDEEIIIKNMNEEHQTIHSFLPNKNIKTFLTRITKKDIYSDEILSEEFFEVENKIDTIILFTDIAKAVIVYRAVTKCIDDENSDITQGFFITAEPNTPIKDLEYYKELKDRKIDRAFDVKSHNEAMNKVLKATSDIPRRFDFELDKLRGDAPNISASPKTTLDDGIKRFSKMQSDFDNIANNGIMDTLIKEAPEHKELFLKDEFVKELNEEFKASFKKASVNLKAKDPISKLTTLYTLPKNILNSFKDKETEIEKTYSDSKNKLMEEEEKSGLTSTHIKDSLLKADEIFEKTKNTKKLEEMFKNKENEVDALLINSWEDAAKFFVGDNKLLLEYNLSAKEELHKVGFRDTSLEISSISYNNEIKIVKSKYWIIEDEFEINKGFILPIFEKDKLKKIIIRPKLIEILDEKIVLKNNLKDEEVIGSSDCEIVLYSKYKKLVIITDDIIKAWLLNQDLYDIATIVVFENEEEFYKSDYFKNNQNELKYLISTNFIFKDKKTYKSETIFLNDFLEEYDSKKFRKEIISYFDDSDFKSKLEKEEKKKEKMGSFYRSHFDAKAYKKEMSYIINKKVEDSLKGAISRAKKELSSSKDGVSDLMNELKSNKHLKDEHFTKANSLQDEVYSKTIGEFEDILSKGINNYNPKDKPTSSSKEIFKKLREELKNTKDKLSAIDDEHFQESKLKSLKEIEKQEELLNGKDFKRLENFDDEIEKELAPVRKMQKEGVIPAWAKKEFKKNFDIDIDEKEIEFESIEEIIAHYNKGGTFKGANLGAFDLSGLDFSNGDFQGANFSHTILKETILQNTNLKNCDFSASVIDKSDFSNSCLISAKLMGCDMKNSNFDKADLSNTIFQGCEIQNVNFDDTNFKNSMFLNANIEKSSFNNSNFEDVLIEKSIFRDSILDEINLEKYLINESEFINLSFLKSKLIRGTIVTSTFINIVFDKSVFDIFSLHNETKLEKIFARNISIEKGSFVKSELIECDFSNSYFSNFSIDKSKIKESLFINCDAKSSSITRTLIQNSNLSKSDFMESSFRKTFFKEVDFSKSNLYRVDFFDIKVNKLNLKNSNIKKTLLEKDNNIKLIEEIEY